jgi:hypothetical protein
MMDRSGHRVRRALAIVLVLVLGVHPAQAQEPSQAAVPMDAFAVDLSAFDLPDEATLAASASASVSDQPPVPVDLGPDQVAARAAALVDASDPALANLDLLAERLAYDPVAAFELVRDSIGYDPYAGTLRGALGTLVARAGNDVDRALLLQALLDRMMVQTRLVVGTLDAATISQLQARAFEPPAEPLATVPVDPQELGDRDTLLTRARRDHALVRGALGDRLAAMGGGMDDGVASTRHVWVQVAQGPTWTDLDPMLPDAQPGDALTRVGAVLDTVPEDWHHTVDVRVIAETLVDGQLEERTVLDHELDAATAARTDIHLAFQPENSSLGQTLGEALGAAAGWLPSLFVGQETFRGNSFPVVPEGDIFTGERDGPQFSRLTLQITVASPGTPTRTTTRTLVDRLSPAARSADTIADDALAPLTLREGVPIELSTIHHIQVSNGAFDARAHQVWRRIAAVFSELMQLDPDAAAAYGFPAAALPMTVGDESLVLASERLISDGLDRSPVVRAFVAQPRVFVTSAGPGTDPGRLTTGVDLLDDSVRVIVADDADGLDAARRQVWYGTLEGALESQFLLARMGAGRLSDGRLRGVSFGLDGAPGLVLPGAAETAGIPDALANDLADGLLAVVPGEGPTGADAWWSVDPATGATRAILAPGTGGGGYVNGSFGGPRIPVDPSRVPQTQAQLNQLYRQALASLESRPPPQPACTIGGSEYTTLQCIAILAAAGFFVLGLVIAIYVWVI